MTREQAIQIAHEEWHTPDTDVAVSLVRMFERLGILKLEESDRKSVILDETASL